MILQRYILRELIVAFCLMFLPVMFISLLGMLFQTLKLVPAAGLAIVVKAIPIAFVYMAPWVLALSTCAATTLVYGRMAADNEIDAIVTSGVHPRRLFTPAILFGLALCAGAYYLAAHGSPAARHDKRVLFRKTLLHLLESPPQGNQTFKLWGRYSLSYVNAEGGVLELPMVVEHLPGGGRRESFAKTGRFVFRDKQAPEIVLVNGEMWEESVLGSARVSGEGNVRVTFEIENLYERSRVPAELTSRELLEHAVKAKEEEKDLERYSQLYTEYHTRRSRGAAPVFLMTICAAIGLFVRKGSRLAGFGTAIPPFLVYVVSDLFFHSLGNTGDLPPALAAWAPNVLLAVLALPLFWRVFRR